MRKRNIVLIAVVVVLVLAVTFLAQALTIYSAQVVAKDKGSAIGFAPFTDRVDFGDVPQGATVAKEITLENNGSASNSIRVFVLGSIGGLVKVVPSSFTLTAGQSQDIELRLTMPDSATPETMFTGRVIILRLPMGLW